MALAGFTGDQLRTLLAPNIRLTVEIDPEASLFVRMLSNAIRTSPHVTLFPPK
jgi:hypothetical protein